MRPISPPREIRTPPPRFRGDPGSGVGFCGARSRRGRRSLHSSAPPPDLGHLAAESLAAPLTHAPCQPLTPHAFMYAALKSTFGMYGPAAGRLWLGSLSVQPMPEFFGCWPRKTLLTVSTAAQPVHSDEMMFTAFTPLLPRIRSSSSANPSPPMT